MRSCYDCKNLALCKLRAELERVVRHNLDMVDTNLPSSDPRCFTQLYRTVAVICTKFVEQA